MFVLEVFILKMDSLQRVFLSHWLEWFSIQRRRNQTSDQVFIVLYSQINSDKVVKVVSVLAVRMQVGADQSRASSSPLSSFLQGKALAC